MPTEIAWSDETWNPTVGCSRISPGCDNCYAIKVAQREMQPAHKGLTRGGDWTGEVRHLRDRLQQPLHWRKPRRVFVDSMSDLFHDHVDREFLGRVFTTMAACPQHTFQILTKRSRQMPEAVLDGLALSGQYDENNELEALPNAWFGASIENDRYSFRADHVRETLAAVGFLSLEPLIGPVPSLDLSGIGWCIIGGESGPGARPMDLMWVEEIIEKCANHNVPIFVKQLGSLWARENNALDRKGGKPFEWPEDLRIREYPA